MTALGLDILTAAKVRWLMDTIFGNEIRVGGFKALTTYHFKAGIKADIALAQTQGEYGSTPYSVHHRCLTVKLAIFPSLPWLAQSFWRCGCSTKERHMDLSDVA